MTLLSFAKFHSSSNLTLKRKYFDIKFIDDNDPTHLRKYNMNLFHPLDLFPSKGKFKFKIEFNF